VVFLDEDQQQTPTDAASEPKTICDSSSLQQLLEPLVRQQRDTADKLATLSSHVQRLEQQIRESFLGSRRTNITERDVAVLFVAFFLQMLLVWWLK